MNTVNRDIIVRLLVFALMSSPSSPKREMRKPRVLRVSLSRIYPRIIPDSVESRAIDFRVLCCRQTESVGEIRRHRARNTRIADAGARVSPLVTPNLCICKTNPLRLPWPGRTAGRAESLEQCGARKEFPIWPLSFPAEIMPFLRLLGVARIINPVG